MYTANITQIATSVSAGPSAVYNYLRPNAFRFVIRDLPNVAYTCQSANLPALQLGFAIQQTPFIDIPRIGDKLTFGDFTIRFLISEDMSNYLELFEWLIALGYPDNYTQYGGFVGERLSRFPFFKNARGNNEALGYSDGTLTILDSNNIPKTNIMLKHLFPVSVEALDYDITSNAVEYLVAIASFKYTSFSIEAL